MISIKDDNTPLVAAFEDEITQEANSDYKLSFKYPAKHDYRPLIKKGIILEAEMCIRDRSGSYLVPGGGLFIKDSELKRLGLKKQRYGGIELYGEIERDNSCFSR